MRFLLLQLADGSFPSGGFAHSGGLEAAVVLGRTDDIGAFLDASLRQTAHAAVPFVRAACLAPADFPALDDTYDATLPMLGPNHASRAQGRALLGAAGRIWELSALREAAHAGTAHHAPVFGAVFGTLDVPEDDAVAAWLHGTARSIASAAVRLGALGPLEAQRILADKAPLLAELLATRHGIEDAAHTAPLIEMYGALHQRLDGRMFQS